MLKLIKTDFSISGKTLILVLIYTLIFPILFRYLSLIHIYVYKRQVHISSRVYVQMPLS